MTDEVTPIHDKRVHLVGHDDHEAYATLQLAASALCAANQLRTMADGPPPRAEYLNSGREMLIAAVAHWLETQPDPEGTHDAMVEVGDQLFSGNDDDWPEVTS